MIAVKIVKWKIAWKKNADLVKDAKSVAGFSPSGQFCVRRNEVNKHGLAAKYSSKLQPPKSLLFRRISSGKHVLQRLKNRWEKKNWKFTCRRWRQKSKLFGVTSLKSMFAGMDLLSFPMFGLNNIIAGKHSCTYTDSNSTLQTWHDSLFDS